MAAMTEQAERYDRIAEGYGRWWAPVIAPAALAVIDEVAAAIDAGATRILDVGTGTGTLAIALLRRWPHIRLTAIDASAGMIEKAGGEADRLLTAAERSRLDLRVAFADDLGLADGSIDVAVSSFVLQLVPNRFRALREVHRVLAPGGVFGWVVLARARGSVGAGRRLRRRTRGRRRGAARLGRSARRSPGSRGRRSADATSRLCGRAGRGRRARPPVHVDGYVGFMSDFDEEDLVQSLPADVRVRFDAALRRRLARRSPAELTLRLPTVTVRGTRR